MPLEYKFSDNISYERKKMKQVDFSDPFFSSFREAYGPYYDKWLTLKKEDYILIAKAQDKIIGFMKLKFESDGEDYSDINPILPSGKRLKISSFKVDNHNHELSSFFLIIAAAMAHRYEAKEVYATIPLHKEYTSQLESFLLKRGFRKYGSKFSHNIEEDVYIISADVFASYPFIVTSK